MTVILTGKVETCQIPPAAEPVGYCKANQSKANEIQAALGKKNVLPNCSYVRGTEDGGIKAIQYDVNGNPRIEVNITRDGKIYRDTYCGQKANEKGSPFFEYTREGLGSVSPAKLKAARKLLLGNAAKPTNDPNLKGEMIHSLPNVDEKMPEEILEATISEAAQELGLSNTAKPNLKGEMIHWRPKVEGSVSPAKLKAARKLLLGKTAKTGAPGKQELYNDFVKALRNKDGRIKPATSKDRPQSLSAFSFTTSFKNSDGKPIILIGTVNADKNGKATNFFFGSSSIGAVHYFADPKDIKPIQKELDALNKKAEALKK